MDAQHSLQFLRAKRGTITKIARAAGISSQAVSQWKEVPAEHVLTVAKVTGKTPHDLRPDLYPDSMDWRGEAQP